MAKHLYLIMIATFVLGAVTGMIVFLLSHVGYEGSGNIREVTNEFVITVRTYGGCDRMGGGTCPSYRVTDSGEYVFFVPKQDGTILQFRGTLLPEELASLKEALDTTPVRDIVEDTFTGTCPIVYDGVAFYYDMILDGESIALDSCEQATDGALFTILSEYVNEFYTRHEHE